MIINKINILSPQKIYNIPFKSISKDDNALQKDSSISDIYYKPIDLSKKQLQNDLLSIKDLHCPICGTKTLDNDQLAEIINTKCETVSDLAKLLNKNKKYLSPNFRPIANNIGKLSIKEPELSIEKTLKKLFKGISFSEKFIIDNLKCKIVAQQKKLNCNEHDNLIIKNIFQNLDNFIEHELPYKDCKNNINDLIAEIDEEKRDFLYQKINPALKEIVSVRYALLLKNYQEYSPDERLEIMLSKMFIGSQREIYSIPPHKTQYSDETVCVCKNCNESRTSLLNPYIPYEKNAENYINYFKDILTAPNVNDAMRGNVVKIRRIIELMSKNNVNMSKVTSSEFDDVKLELYNIESASSGFAPSKFNGVTCAACGCETLPYDEKINLRSKVDNANDIYELQNLIHENSHYIKDNYKEAFELYDKLLEENPNITEDEMLTALKTFYTNRILKNFNELNYIANKNLFSPQTTSDDKWRYVNYIKNTKDFYEDTNKSFPMLDFFNISARTIENIDDIEEANTIDKLIRDIKQDWFIQNILYPPKEYFRATKSELRETINYAFSRASISTIHILSKSYGGDDKPDNLMIVCTDCRKTKKDKPLDLWVYQYEKIPSNMQTYVKSIQKVIRDNNLEDYANYPQDFIDKVKKLTNSKINLELPKNS